MIAKTYRLIPVDTWFFRDGRPFNMGESDSSNIRTLFPPFAMTVVGAMRASFARSLGWNGKSNWPMEIKSKLGDGQDLGPLRFRGPYLIREKNSKSEVLFPVPLHLLGKPSEKEEGQWEDITILLPGKETDCDIGEKVRLPTSKNVVGLSSLYGYYLTYEDLEIVLKGGDLSKVCPIQGDDTLWDYEYLVGIQMIFETRIAEEGKLYSSSRVRLKPGVSLALQVEGLVDEVELQSPLTFGGEGKLAYADHLDNSLKIPDAPELNCSSDDRIIRFTVTHLTPAYLEGRWPGPGEALPGIPGSKVVSACIERPIRIGGWDTIKREPLPLKPFLPGGSTWFCEADGSHAEEIRLCNGKYIGKYSEYGFGEIAIGSWNDEEREGTR